MNDVVTENDINADPILDREHTLSIKRIEKIYFYIATNDNFFVTGAKSYIENCMAYKQQYDSFEFIVIEKDPQQFISMVREMLQDNCLHIVIADNDFIGNLLLFLNYWDRQFLLLISMRKCTVSNLSSIIESPELSFRLCFDLPRFYLLGELSQKEKKMCYYFYLGYSMKHIGTLLGITPKTVSGYFVRIMHKTGCTKKNIFNNMLINYYHCLQSNR